MASGFVCGFSEGHFCLAYSLSESANPREVGNLVKLAKIDENVRRFIIVTKEEEDTVEKDDVSIEIIPAWKFLLDLAARDGS